MYPSNTKLPLPVSSSKLSAVLIPEGTDLEIPLHRSDEGFTREGLPMGGDTMMVGGEEFVLRRLPLFIPVPGQASGKPWCSGKHPG